MAEKYISVSAAIQAKPEYLNENREYKDLALYAKGWNACNEEYIDNLLDIPAAAVRPVKEGQWVPVTNGRGGHECDQCHDYAPSYPTGEERLSDFCPNCGAKMGGRKEVQTNETRSTEV